MYRAYLFMLVDSDIEIEIEMGDEKEREERARSLFTMYRVRQAREDMDTLKQEAESEDGIFAQVCTCFSSLVVYFFPFLPSSLLLVP